MMRHSPGQFESTTVRQPAHICGVNVRLKELVEKLTDKTTSGNINITRYLANVTHGEVLEG